jgi:hypothetical protein
MIATLLYSSFLEYNDIGILISRVGLQGNTALHWAIYAKNSCSTSILVNKAKGSDILVMKNAQVRGSGIQYFSNITQGGFNVPLWEFLNEKEGIYRLAGPQEYNLVKRSPPPPPRLERGYLSSSVIRKEREKGEKLKQKEERGNIKELDG